MPISATDVNYKQTKEKRIMNLYFLYFLIHSPRGSSHITGIAPCSPLWKSRRERVGLTDTAMLITMWLSAKEKQGLECFVHF